MSSTSIQKMLENNPLIDRKAFERSLEDAEALADIGVRPRQYSLKQPLQRVPAVVRRSVTPRRKHR